MSEEAQALRLVIAAPHSGCGKTMLTAGLIAALHERGLRVQPFKVGPDYIDPSYHTLAAGRVCRNLDSWMLPAGGYLQLFERAARGMDCAIIEGVMGVYDGAGYDTESGSTAEIAKQLGAPVVIVLDAAKVARTIGAIALGLMMFDRELNIIGFIANRVGSESHGRGVAASVSAATGKPCFGFIPRDAALAIPERHLGLIPTAESGASQKFIEAARRAVENNVSVESMLEAARSAQPRVKAAARPGCVWSHQGRSAAAPVIAVARDEAFSFIYPENLELLREAGARIAFFSPLHDSALPAGARGIILSGGFPEVYAASLSANHAMHAQLREAHRRDLPILAECGGLMYLTEAITDLNGTVWPMAALLPGASIMTEKLTLGYRVAQAAGDGPLLARGETVRGHEFHYSSWQGRPAALPPAFWLPSLDRSDATPRADGARLGKLWATYVHTHFLALPSMAIRFAAACRG